MAKERITYKQMLMILINIVSTLKEKKIFLPREKSDFRLKSDSFKNGKKLPKKYTPFGKDINPELHWSGVPRNTRSFALIVDDPDAPSGVFAHWVVKNIPGNVNQIKEGSVPGEEIKNNWGFTKYSGPKPPNGQHRYIFKLYAIRENELRARTLNALRKEIEAKKVGEAVIMARYPG